MLRKTSELEKQITSTAVLRVKPAMSSPHYRLFINSVLPTYCLLTLAFLVDQVKAS